MSGRARTTQELIHWLEMGEGARWVRLGALVLAAVIVSAAVAWKQFHGAASEATLAQAKVDQILLARDRMRPFEEAAQRLEDETKLYTTLRLTLRQREIDFQVPKRTIEILNTAEAPRTPGRPNWILNLGSAVVFGLLLGLGTALTVEYFDTSLRDVADVEERLKVPVLGVIPHNPDTMGPDKDEPEEAEPYRVLHTNINLALKPGECAVLVVFSAGPAEGKSTTLCRLGHLMGAYGERVLLVDGDLRRPSQHHLASCPKGPGLSDILAGRCDFDAAVRRAVAPGFDLLTSGGMPGFTLSLAYADKLRELLVSLRGRYERILLDSPPIIGVSDSSLLAGLSDGALLLIQHRATRRAWSCGLSRWSRALRPGSSAPSSRRCPRAGERTTGTTPRLIPITQAVPSVARASRGARQAGKTPGLARTDWT
jgi:polysaccharide biosynthesis transport protein